MHQILGITVKIFRVRRSATLALAASLALLLSASGAKAGGCAVGYSAGARLLQFLSSALKQTTIKSSKNHTGMPSSVYGT